MLRNQTGGWQPLQFKTEFTREEVKEFAAKLKNRKAGGVDDIVNDFLW